jgi:hypothetical protein
MSDRTRFLATLSHETSLGPPTLVAATAGSVLLGGAGMLLPSALAEALAPAAAALGVLGSLAFLAVTLRPRRVPVHLEGGHLVVDEGRGGAYPWESAVLGRWSAAGIDLAAGAALVLSDGRRTYTLGGHGHPAPDGAREIHAVDAALGEADFAALLAVARSFDGRAR